VTKADTSRVVSKYLKPTQWPVIVVGPRIGNEDKIRSLDLGPVEVRSPDEKPGAPKPAQASSRRLKLDRSPTVE
jgi:hypothetical protein